MSEQEPRTPDDGGAAGDGDATTGGDDERSRLVDRLSRFVEMLTGSSVELRPYAPLEDAPLVESDVPTGHEEVDRYWLNAPFAYASITYDDEENEHYYDVVEPSLSEFDAELLETLYDDIRDPLLFKQGLDGDPEQTLKEELRDRLQEYGVRIDTATFYTLFYYLNRRFRGFGKIDALMHDPNIEDISCDGYSLPLYAYHDEYQDIETSVQFDEEEELDSFVIKLAQQSGRHISVGNPVVETTLQDGSRAELALGEEVTPRGSAFTIRKYSAEPFTPIDLLDFGTYNLEQMAYLWMAIEHNKNIIFAGGTASGKTTSMNAISMFIPPRSKLISIEDTRELSLYHDNWLSAVTRERLDEAADVTMYDLLRSALRHRPEYILVGEVRGKEAITLFQAMNTGHTTLSTMHADSVQTVINRLENEPINVPRPMVQSLDVLCVQTLARFEGERVRRADAIAEIEGIDQRTGELDYATAFEWRAADDTVREGNRNLLDEIREERGWSQTELLKEFRRRKRFLDFLSQQDITQYRQFTAMINRYYADPEGVMERAKAAADGPLAGMESGSDDGVGSEAEAGAGLD
ncbi:type II/IV secretion system ATPase subunit [Salinirubellus salinus]|uniref:Type II/IV secretion system ATPase subunit n=1 Tax=Salinirubellus salinus TaxID=1364945 RepID=A0A9E7R6A5_9EURY|nr:type II/IV secretion system ATPase subunit [Salinirubellus salinus]UWM56397.1 type II/IV secretion system ATPase subunit [Salinirubellus salinus]